MAMVGNTAAATETRRTSAVARRLVLAALNDPASVAKLAPGDLDLTLRLMRRARLIGRLACHLRERGLLESLPSAAVDQLASALISAEARARVARWELNRLEWALRDLPQDVPLVAMKGCAYLLAGTPNAAGRIFADVDLLVPEAHLPLVEGMLKERGWRATELSPYDERYYREWAHELPPMRHREREVEVDLHHNILMRTARLKPAPGLLFATARPVPGSRFKVLAPADMVLHAIVHLFYGGEMDGSLRELVDIDDLLRHFGAAEPGFWEGFWGRVERLDLGRPSFYGLHFARALLGTPVPGSIIAASRAGQPGRAFVATMSWAVSRALFPQGPGSSGRGGVVARRLLYLRSHWVKMPALMLARHLARKTLVARADISR